MKDEQLIWELYMKNHEKDTGETPWNDKLHLNNGVTLSDIPEAKLMEYFELVIEDLTQTDYDLEDKYGYSDQKKFREWAKPNYMDYSIRRSNEYLNNKFGFTTHDFDKLGTFDDRSDQISDYITAIKLRTFSIISYDYLINQ